MKQRIPCNTEVAVRSGREGGIKTAQSGPFSWGQETVHSSVVPEDTMHCSKVQQLAFIMMLRFKNQIQTELSLPGFRRPGSALKGFCQKQIHLIVQRSWMGNFSLPKPLNPNKYVLLYGNVMKQISYKLPPEVTIKILQCLFFYSKLWRSWRKKCCWICTYAMCKENKKEL